MILMNHGYHGSGTETTRNSVVVSSNPNGSESLRCNAFVDLLQPTTRPNCSSLRRCSQIITFKHQRAKRWCFQRNCDLRWERQSSNFSDRLSFQYNYFQLTSRTLVQHCCNANFELSSNANFGEGATANVERSNCLSCFRAVRTLEKWSTV